MPCQLHIHCDGIRLEGALFDHPVAAALRAVLPVTIPLTYWGEEAYGPIGHDLGESSPRERIPPGGIAYTRRGGLLCLFFGQDPAWPVEHIGALSADSLKILAAIRPHAVTISLPESATP